MKQVLLSGQGQIEIFDVPLPGYQRQGVLVRNAFSLISSGTEGAAVTRKSGLIGLYEKATASHDRIQQVWEMAKAQGISQTYELVRQKLMDYTAIGYSCAGLVVESSEAESGFRVGDRVACMGTGFATHSEFVAVPRNLVAKIPPGVSYEQASFGAVAAIALQGIRRLELTPGESIGVIGLGLIGQIAVRLLAAMGYRVYGVDLAESRAQVARACEGVTAWSSASVDVAGAVRDATRGRLLDGVLICAATDSDAVVNLAFDLCRQRGRVSVVGDIGLGLQRAKMYAKELELRLSCSYGPGRYDPSYELQGVDYPIGLVRWTEGRNLEFFLGLLESGRLDLSSLISSRHAVAQATNAYAALKSGASDNFGVLLDYGLDDAAAVAPQNYAVQRVVKHVPSAGAAPAAPRGDIVRLGLIGVGGYAKAVHVPNLLKSKHLFQISAVASRTGASAAVVAQKTGAAISTSDYRRILDDPQIDAVLISTRHASHGAIVLDAIQAGKHVFVEKPMTIDADQGLEIVNSARDHQRIVRVGFNRRFAPHLCTLKSAVGDQGRRILICRINIGALGNDWSSAAEEGGRLMGEGVHFLDLCNWFAGQDPLGLSASIAGEPDLSNPNATITVSYPDGSTGVIVYTTLGSKQAGKEWYEAIGNGRVVQVDDFSSYQAYGAGGRAPRDARNNKGQLPALQEFAAQILGKAKDKNAGADAHAGWLATRMAIAVYESARSGSFISFK